MSNARREEGEPFSDATKLANVGMEAVRQANNDACVIVMTFVDRGSDTVEGGIALGGYEDDTDAIADMFLHLRAIMESNGKTLEIINVPTRGQG